MAYRPTNTQYSNYNSRAAISHFSDPIPNDGQPHGYSRRPGDASEAVKTHVIDCIIKECADQGLSKRDTAHVLAIARIESGFNPDAAAPTSSASGVGQFITRTGASYGLDNRNRFDLQDNVRALVEHYRDNKELAMSNGKGESWIYAYHHDGPGGGHGGLQLAKEHVMPYVDRYNKVLAGAKDYLDEIAKSTGNRFDEWAQSAKGMVASFEHGVENLWQSKSFEHAKDPTAENISVLRQALANHMSQHGFDGASIAQAAQLAEMVGKGHAVEPHHDALVLHKQGEALASTMPSREAQAYAANGDSVLSVNTMQNIVQHGLDMQQIEQVRAQMPQLAKSHSDLEVAQAANPNAWSSEPRAQGGDRQEAHEQKVAAQEAAQEHTMSM